MPIISRYALASGFFEHIGGSLPKFLPEASLLTFQAVEFPFDFAGFYAPIPLFQPPNIDSTKTVEFSQLMRYGTVLYGELFQEELGWSGRLRIEKTGRMSALRFITQNLIAIDTQTQSSIEWPNQFLILPLVSPVDVNAGDEVRIEFGYRAGGSLDSLSSSIQIEMRKPNLLPQAG